MAKDYRTNLRNHFPLPFFYIVKFLKCAQSSIWKKYTSGPRYWNIPVLVNTGTFFVYQYCLKMWYLRSLEHAGVIQKEKVNFRSQILVRPSIGEYWNTFGVPVLPENVIFTFFRMCWCYSEDNNTVTQKWFSIVQYSCTSIWDFKYTFSIQKLTILERKNGLVLSNTHVPVSGTWSILFPSI